MIAPGDPIDPGSFQPDLNLIEPGVLPPGMPTPIPTAKPVDNSFKNIMYASAALSSISAITTALGESAAYRAQGDYESSIADTNAAIARFQAKQTLEIGDVEAGKKVLQTQQEVGAERAVQGGSGIDVASGSAALVRAGTAGVGAVDELTIRNNAARRAWGFQTEAIQSTYQGQFAKLTAKTKSFQTLLSGGLQAIEGPLGMYARYKYMQRYLGVRGGPELETGTAGLPYPSVS